MSMTTLLPPIDTHYFPSSINRYHARRTSLSLTTPANASSTTLGTVVNRTLPASPTTTSSNRLPANNENGSPRESEIGLHHGQRTVSLGSISNRTTRPPLAAKRRYHRDVDRFFTASIADSSSDHEPVRLVGSGIHRGYRQLLRKPPRGRTNDPVQQNSRMMMGSESPRTNFLERGHARLPWSSDVSRRESTDVFNHHNERRSFSDSQRQQTTHSSIISPMRAQSPKRDHFTHRKRPSTVSSAFVHTVKTASLTNTTISFLSRSLRLTHSSDNQIYRGSDPRQSIDSDRPGTTSSVDEAALHRGIKRHQVIEEIIKSEEGYVADLKALVFLYSTLLASASSLSDRARVSIQRNVIDLLHLHEHMLDQMHRLSFMSAQRKWFDTTSPRKLGMGHHIRWHSLESRVTAAQYRSHKHTRSSNDTPNPLLLSTRSCAVEPVEAAEMARVFKDSMSRFDAYEEYCAKHERMMRELNRKIPAWSDYGFGIESLAKSVNSIEQRATEGRRALTVGDLLMKPIQRVCKYPLLLGELLKQTPVMDGPEAHAVIEATLQQFREAVKEINVAADNPAAQAQIERRWTLHQKLDFREKVLQSHQFRLLGHATHCGVLHVAYQTRSQVDGYYALCILFPSHLIVALPSSSSSKFLILAVIHLSDLKLESCTDGRGLQCHTALFCWKLCFEVDGQLYELIMSAYSAAEEEAWKRALRTKTPASVGDTASEHQISSAIGIDLKPAGVVFGQAGTLTRRLSIQRAATVGNRNSVCQVIIRGTHHAPDFQELRQSSAAINRSQSHQTAHRTAVLAPKRSARAKMESTLANVWTRDTLPPPNMAQSRGGQIIRASAGSLVRKLSLASIHAPFGRRSASLTLNSRISAEAFTDSGRSSSPMPIYQVQKNSQELDGIVRQEADLESEDLNETEMEKDDLLLPICVASIASKRRSLRGADGLLRRGTKVKYRGSRGNVDLGPEDSAKRFYSVSEQVVDMRSQYEVDIVVEEKLRSRKRWSNPMGFLGEGIKHMIFSSNHK